MADTTGGKSQPSKTEMESRVRTAAIVAAKGATIGEGLLARIIAETSYMSDPAAREALAMTKALEYTAETKALNIHSATNEQLEQQRRAQGLPPAQRGMDFFSRTTDARDERGEGGSRSSAYTRELAGGDVLKSLVSQGYSREHAMGAIAFAHEMGTSEDMARKFVKIGKEGQDKVKAFVEGLDPNLSEEDRKKAVAEFRKKNPKEAKHLSEEDLLKIQRDHHKKQFELRGGQTAAYDDTQAKIVAESQKTGIEGRVEQHVKKVANLVAQPAQQVANVADLEAALAVTEKQPDGTGVKQQASATAIPASSKTASTPQQPERRQASTGNGIAPKVG